MSPADPSVRSALGNLRAGILFFSCLLAGCASWWGPSASDLNVARLEATMKAERDARAREDAARAEAEKEKGERIDTAAAYAVAADEAADHLEDGLPKTAVKTDLGIVTKALPDPSPKRLADARGNTILILDGKLEESRVAYAKIQTALVESEKKSAAAEAKVAEAQAVTAKTVAASDAALLKTKADYEAKLESRDAEWKRKEAEKDAQHRRDMDAKDADMVRVAQGKLQERYVTGASVCGALMLILALLGYFNQNPKIWGAAVLNLVMALVFSSMAIAVGSDYVKVVSIVAIGTGLVAVFAYIAYYVIVHRREIAKRAADKVIGDKAKAFDEVYTGLTSLAGEKKLKEVAPDTARALKEAMSPESMQLVNKLDAGVVS